MQILCKLFFLLSLLLCNIHQLYALNPLFSFFDFLLEKPQMVHYFMHKGILHNIFFIIFF